MDRLAGRQAGFNAASRGQWDAFAEHRRHLTAALGRGPTAPAMATGVGGRLALLGAGNGNDLDLPTLLAAYREVHLVDLDAGALAQGAARQGVAGHPGLHRHGALDVTATLGLLAAWSPATDPAPAELAALAEWPAVRAAAVLPGRFDRVASTCLVSQILETARHALGAGHPRLGAVEAALLAGHLRLLARLAAPGGEALLVGEVVAAGTLPGLPGLPPAELVGLLPRLRRAGNHFRGVHPDQILATLRADPAIGPLGAASVLAPWRWRLHDRTYLVSGVRFRVAPGRGR